MNIVSNFIPHEKVMCDNRDPPWINTGKYLCSGKNTKIFEEFKLLQNKIVNLTNDSMIQETDIIPEYIINLVTLTYPPKFNFKHVFE